MRAFLPLAFLLLIAATSLAQFYITPPKGELAYVVDGVQIGDQALVFDREPAFPGGRFELFRYLEANITANGPGAQEAALGGESLISFRLDAAGRVSKPEMLRTNTPSLEFAFLRAVENMPDWEPAILEGVETAVTVYLPLGYQTNGGILIFDESTNKAVLGREPANWWLKAVLLVGAVAVFAGLFFGLQ
jgi:hypothetical protein